MANPTNSAKNKAEERPHQSGQTGPSSGTAEKGQTVASTVSQAAESATAAMGSGLKSLSDTIREHSPDGGMVKQASSAVADTLERTGRYLQEEGFQGLAEDVTRLIRRNPLPTLLVGLGVGFLIARAMTSRS